MMDNNYASLFPEGTIDDETYFKMQQRQQLAGLQNLGGMDYPFGQLQPQQQQQNTNSFVGSNMLSSNHLDLPQLQMLSGANGQSMQNMQSQLNNHRQMNSQNFAGLNQNLSSVLPQGHSFLDQGVGNYSSNMMLQQLLLQQAQQDNNLFQSSFSGNGLGGGDALNMASFANQHVTGDQLGFPSQSIERQLEVPAFEQQQHCQPLLGLMTLQSLDAADFPVEKRRKTTKNKRDKNRPKQPLSAYNIFFKDERAKMLMEIKEVDDTEEGNSAGDDAKSGNKRQREPSSGKIGFEKMAKTIARRWKEIAKDDLKTYEARAADDQKRYKAELAVYLEKKREESGLENELKK